MLTPFPVAGGLIQNEYWKKNQRYQPRGTEIGGIGASGCISGLFGATTLASPFGRVAFIFVPMPMWLCSFITIGGSIACIQTETLPWIGHMDHLGGMAFGAVFCK